MPPRFSRRKSPAPRPRDFLIFALRGSWLSTSGGPFYTPTVLDGSPLSMVLDDGPWSMVPLVLDGGPWSMVPSVHGPWFWVLGPLFVLGPWSPWSTNCPTSICKKIGGPGHRNTTKEIKDSSVKGRGEIKW